MKNEEKYFEHLCELSIQDSFDVNSFLDDYDKLKRDIIFEYTTRKKMLPFIAYAALKVGIDVDFWRPIYEKYLDRNKTVLNALNEVYSAFEKKGVQKAFVSENFGSMLSAGGNIGLFASGDIDNYADISEYGKIKEALEKEGFESKDRYARNLLISTDFTHETLLPKGFEIGIDWFPLSRLTMPCFIQADDFVDWERLQNYKDTFIKIPPADALMYICLLHISLHSYCRAPGIRLYRDIINASKSITEKDWENIFIWAKRDHVMNRLTTSAFLSNKVANVNMPDWINEEKADNLIEIVYDSHMGLLRPEPTRWNVLQIEAISNDTSALQGILDIIKPEEKWMNSVYSDISLASYIKHLKDVL